MALVKPEGQLAIDANKYSLDLATEVLYGAADLSSPSSTEAMKVLRQNDIGSESSVSLPPVLLSEPANLQESTAASGAGSGPESDQNKIHDAVAKAKANASPIKKDEQGRIVEIDYPDGTSREFGYVGTTSTINKVVQPDGMAYILKDGNWYLDATQNEKATKFELAVAGAVAAGRKNTNGAPPPSSLSSSSVAASDDSATEFGNPQIRPNGAFIYKIDSGTGNGATYTSQTDGSKQEFTEEGAVVNTDANDQVISVYYSDGSYRKFTYDDQNQMTGLNENGTSFAVINNQVCYPVNTGFSTVNLPTGRLSPAVESDGTFEFTQPNGDRVTTFTDRTSNMVTVSLGTVQLNESNQVVQIGRDNGQQARFTYDPSGKLTSMTDFDGKVYSAKAIEIPVPIIGAASTTVFVADDGSAVSWIKAGQDGTISYSSSDGKAVTEYASGITIVSSQTVTTLAQDASKIHNDALQSLGLPDSPATKEINKILDGLNATDRLALEQEYLRAYQTSMQADIQNFLGDDAGAHAQMVLADATLRGDNNRIFNDDDGHIAFDNDITGYEQTARKRGLSELEIAQTEQSADQYMLSHGGSEPQSDLFNDTWKVLTDDAPVALYPRPLYANPDNWLEDIKPENCKQGELGDCHFVSAVAALAKEDPKAIHDMIKDNGNGTYTVTFPGDSSHPQTVYAPSIDELNDYTKYASGTWMNVLEEAYRKHVGSDTRVDEGGQIKDDFLLLTGNSATEYALDGPIHTKQDDVALYLQTAVQNHQLIGAATASDDEWFENNPGNVTPTHAYAVLGYDAETKMVTLRNPWGSDEYFDKTGKNNGEFQMSLSDFCKHFHVLDICNL